MDPSGISGGCKAGRPRLADGLMSASESACAGDELAPDLRKQEARGTASERQRCSQWRHKDKFYNQDWQEQGELVDLAVGS